MSIDESIRTVVIGGGQAGLAAGYHLSRRGSSFVILDDSARTGDTWRRRWDSLRLFTPSKFNGLPGKPFGRPDFYFPTKDEMADYLEGYAGQFGLPIRHNVRVNALSRAEKGFVVSTGAGSLHARNVIVATGAYQKPYTPPFARELDPEITQFHASAYCNSLQVPAQNVLVVGAGNSGAEIGLELARAGKRVWLSGRNVGSIPADKVGKAFGGWPYWFLISRVLNVSTPIGRKMQAQMLHHGAPLIRASLKEITGAGIELAPRVAGVESGKPRLEDGRSMPVEAVIWATGFRPDYQWMDLPVFDEHGIPRHRRGIAREAPGLFFVGLPFQTALSSALVGGVGADAEYIVGHMR